MKIAVMKFFKESFKDVLENKMKWLRVTTAPLLIWFFGFLWMVITLLVSGQSLLVLNGMHPSNSQTLPLAILIGNSVFTLAAIVAYICLMINTYRYAAFKEGGDSWWTLNLNWRFLKVLYYGFLLMLLFFLYIASSVAVFGVIMDLLGGLEMPSLIAPFILTPLLVIFGLYAFARMGLTLFLVAIDHKRPIIAKSWWLLKGNVLRFIGLKLLVMLSMALLTTIGICLLTLLAWGLVSVSPVLAAIAVVAMTIFEVLATYTALAVSAKADSFVYNAVKESVQKDD